MSAEPDLAPGDSSEWVTFLQETLNSYYQQTVVATNGVFDDATAAVVRSLRDHASLPAGAHVDAALWMLMLESDSGDAGDGGAEGTGSGPDTETGSGPERGLDGSEIAAAQSVFGDTLDTSGIVLTEGGPLAVGGYARTLPDYITFPAGTLSAPSSNFMKWLVHELGHCWQYQHGASIPGLLWSALGADYDYGGPDALIDAAVAGKAFADFGYEEQASIFADYYKALQGGDPAPFEPYIRSIRDDTWRNAPTAESVP